MGKAKLFFHIIGCAINLLMGIAFKSCGIIEIVSILSAKEKLTSTPG